MGRHVREGVEVDAVPEAPEAPEAQSADEATEASDAAEDVADPAQTGPAAGGADDTAADVQVSSPDDPEV
ncbi:hypothetical protein EXU48_22275 [Occultella glacieicola]|uniref:Uncharacterized protein n=1 Tax=Occultella glacieicola TaxID=2518684 RepID=A0ABY2E0S0_9MICO|nr:hypothetical protein [Occultella glacieicola]TDE88817.1 hypothetical protein EXU48_22275 [Occultella glacieicola]